MSNVDMNLVKRLKDKAKDIRKQILEMTHIIGNAHLGGSLSMTDMVVALYYHFMNYDPQNPEWPERDRFVLSKGHSGACLYNVYADLGLYDRKLLHEGYNKIDGRFGQHPNRKYVPGIEASTGSLGHGLSIASGMAYAGRAEKADWRVFCMTGDGELQAGSNWEAIMTAGHLKLGNLVAIVDRNRIQGTRHTEEINALEPLEDKWRSFGWDAMTTQGNDMKQVVETLSILPPVDSVTPRKPICIISETVKGCGIPFMEDRPEWHIGGLDDEKLAECLLMLDESA